LYEFADRDAISRREDALPILAKIMQSSCSLVHVRPSVLVVCHDGR